MEEERIRKEAIKIGKETGLKEGKKKGAEQERIKMARSIKRAGETIEKIKKYTKLSEEEIEKL